MSDTTALLDIDDLRVSAPGSPRRPLVDGISFSIGRAESVGLVGESGSGKSMTIRAATRLLARGLDAEGRIAFDGQDVLRMPGRDLSRYRSRDVGIIHQDPRAHIDPMRTIGDFIVEGVLASGQMSRSDAYAAARDLVRQVGIPDADRRLGQYPHQLSGGLLQRVMIVAALLPSPRLIFADEPTTALDVTVQSEVVAIMLEQIEERQASLLFITHDLDLASAITDRLVVMYAGRVAETGPADLVTSQPLHPYTAGLLASRPSTTERRRLRAIPGRPITAFEAGPACAFADRCRFAQARCREERPIERLIDVRTVACHRSEEIADELAEEAR